MKKMTHKKTTDVPTINLSPKFINQIVELELNVLKNAKHISMIETILFRLEADNLALKNDVAELQRKQKNSYGVV